jgi:hypothetical protein
MNVIIEMARSPQNDHPDQQHETDSNDRWHLISLPIELLYGDCYTAIIATYSMPAATFHPD